MVQTLHFCKKTRLFYFEILKILKNLKFENLDMVKKSFEWALY